MGVYDYLKGPCPTCGEEIGADTGDIQVKWFVGVPNPDDCFRTFRPGDKLPEVLPDGEYLTYDEGWPLCACQSRQPLYAMVKDGRFAGFTREPTGETHDLNYERRAVEAAVQEVVKRYEGKPHKPPEPPQ